MPPANHPAAQCSTPPNTNALGPKSLGSLLFYAHSLLMWTMQPALLMINLGLGVMYRLHHSIPPIRWACSIAGGVCQLFFCIQVTFVGLTLLQLVSSVICIGLCDWVGYVQQNIEKASLAAVIRKIYL